MEEKNCEYVKNCPTLHTIKKLAELVAESIKNIKNPSIQNNAYGTLHLLEATYCSPAQRRECTQCPTYQTLKSKNNAEDSDLETKM